MLSCKSYIARTISFHLVNNAASTSTKKRASWLEWLMATFWALIIAIIIKLFLFEVFVIPSTSMEHSLLVGDYVLMSKLNYGPRLPITPLAFPFSHNEMPLIGGKSYHEDYQWNYRRLPGILGIERGDILVFNYPLQNEPIDRREHFVKRCVGFPGDDFKIVNGNVYCNGEKLERTEEMQFDYNLITSGKRLGREWMQRWKITEGGQRSMKGHYQFAMTPQKADSLSKEPYIKRIEKANLAKGIVMENETVFPHDPVKFPWNIDNYGSLKVPKKGDTVQLNETTLKLYQRIIERYENHKIEMVEDDVWVDGKRVKEYVFEMDYFFMVGDNRHNSADSRFWGFVPENHIVGKAFVIIFSVEPGLQWFHRGGIRWDRLFDWI